MSKKKLLAVIIFVFFGFFAFSFANPSENNENIVNNLELPNIDVSENNFKMEVFSEIPEFNGKVSEGVKLSITNDINKNVVGTYKVTFKATDVDGRINEVSHDFYVVDTKVPVITLNGSDEIVRINTVYKDKGAKAKDNYDKDITKNIVVKNNVLINKKGTYEVTYNVKDSSGNKAKEQVRKVTVVDDTLLKNKIKEARDYLNEYSKELDSIIKSLEKEIKKSESIIKDNLSTQEEIDDSIKNLDEIIDSIKNKTFKVKFVNYNDKLIKEVEVKYNEDATLPENPTRKGYSFKSWNNSVKNIKSSLVVKAQYELVNYKITYDLNGGSNNKNKETYNVETKTFKLNGIEKVGYVFDSWKDEEGNVVKEIKNGTTGDLKLTASFKESENTKYKIVYKYQQLDNSYKELEEEKTGKTNKEITLNINKKGYKVNEELSTLTGKVKADGSLVLTVTLDLNEYNVYFYVDNTLYKKETYRYQEEIKVPKYTIKEGYDFISWIVDNKMPAKDMKYYATTSKKEFIVTFKYYKDGKLTEIEQKVKYNENAVEPKYDELIYIEGTNPYYLEFKRWNKSLKNIKENVKINAEYEKLGIATTRLYRLVIRKRPSNGEGRNPIWYEELGKNKNIKFVLSANKINNVIAKAKKNKKHEAVLSLNQNEIYNYMTDESKAELKSIETAAIKKYEKLNFLKKNCQFEWYVLKYNSNDGWHLDGEITKCKSIFD